MSPAKIIEQYNAHVQNLHWGKSSRWQLISFVSQVMSNCFKYFLCCQIANQEMRSFMPHQFVRDIFWVKTKILIVFCVHLHMSTKEISIFQNTFNGTIVELPPTLHLELIYLQCNDMIKRKYKAKSVVQSYGCFWRDD